MGRSKVWLDFGGRPLLAHVVARVQPWVHAIVLVAAPGQDLPALADTDVPVTVVRDDRPGEGPLPALARGLTAITQPWALTLACDAPFVRPSVVAHLARARGADVEAVVPTWNGRVQPLVALYRRRLAPVVVELVERGERRLHVLASLLGVRIVAEDVLALSRPRRRELSGIEHARGIRGRRRCYVKPS
jgi:molybdopterin-guanine dinucleotide biosynthesis protein A